MAQLTDVLLGADTQATSGWAAASGRSYDVVMDDYSPGNGSIACDENCNKKKFGPRIIGWIARFRAGESLDDLLVELVEQSLHPVALDRVARGRKGLLDT